MAQTSWDDFYKKTKDENIPWRGVNEDFFKHDWDKFNLPQNGNALDVGCGTGDKALFLARRGFEVWGMDISETAVKRASKKAKGLKTKPKFFKQDAVNISSEVSLKGVRLDIIFDILCTQFLGGDEKLVYLKGLNQYVKSGETFYILVNFAKEKKPPKDQPSWIRDVAMSKKEVKETYGKYFKIVNRDRYSEQKGKVDRYILKAE